MSSLKTESFFWLVAVEAVGEICSVRGRFSVVELEGVMGQEHETL